MIWEVPVMVVFVVKIFKLQERQKLMYESDNRKIKYLFESNRYKSIWITLTDEHRYLSLYNSHFELRKYMNGSIWSLYLMKQDNWLTGNKINRKSLF
jgi:hypothetical protein